MTRLLSILAALSLVASPQTQRDAARPAPSVDATGAIAGTVVSDDASARPLRYANVIVIGALTGTVRVTSTDANGRFNADGLPADRYVVGASKAPYLGAEAGAKRPAHPGVPIVLARGRKISDVVVKLPMGAAIAGTIMDERGQPSGNAAVALQQWRNQNGQRTLVSVPNGTTRTDERGRYRIFGLAPGEYLVTAMNLFGMVPPTRQLSDADVDAALKGGPVAPSPPASAPSLRYAPVFYPGTTRSSDAQPILLAAGDERLSVDFRMEAVRLVRVDGVALTADGQPVAGAAILSAQPGSGALQMTMAARSGADGRFMFQNVSPGTYTLLVQPTGPQAGQLFAITSVEVAGADVGGIQVTLQPPLSIEGHLAFAGMAAAPSLAGRQIALKSLTTSAAGIATPQVTSTDTTGAFKISRVVPGRYAIGAPLFFGASADSVTWALDSVVVDGKDVTDLPLDISADNVPKDVVVTFSDRWQTIAGTLATPRGVAAPDYTIIVFPADKAYWMYGSRRILTVHPASDGRFSLGGPGPISLPAGAYLLAVATDLDRDEQFDPAFLASLVPAGVPVTLTADEKKIQDLAIR